MRPLTADYSYLAVTASTTAAPKQLVPAATNRRHRILGLTITATTGQHCTLQSSTGGVLLGPLHVAAGTPLVLPPSWIGYAETVAGRGIFCQSDNATATSLLLTYQTFRSS